MEMKQYFIYIIITILMSISCKSRQSLASEEKILPLNNRTECIKEWEKRMESGKEVVKSYWIKDLESEYLKNYRIQMGLERDNIYDIQLEPVTVYQMDSISFSNYNMEKMESYLKLDTTQAHFYVFNKTVDEYVAVVFYGVENNSWFNKGGFSPLCPELKGIINNLFKEEKVVYGINIYPYPGSRPDFKFGFMSYYDKDEMLDIGGKPMKIVIQELYEREYGVQSTDYK